jgi:hypothetical protein
MTVRYAALGRPHAPSTADRDYPTCGRCSGCHPGRQWGGDEKCVKPACRCHHRSEVGYA